MFGDETNLRAVVLPAIRVDNASVATASILVSPPSPVAALGLMRKIEIDLQGVGILPTGWNPFRSVAIAVHEFEISPGHRRIPPEMPGESGDKSGSMVDDPEGRLVCTLVISAELGNRDVLGQVKDFLSANVRRYRFGGGRIIRSGIMGGETGGGKWRLNPVETAWNEEEFQKIVRVLPPGSVLADRTWQLGPKDEADHRDALDRLLDFVVAVKRPIRAKGEEDEQVDMTRVPRSDERWEWRKLTPGWLVPVAVGWRALSDVRERIGMRAAENVIGHVWAEDVIGLGEWVSVRRAFSKPRDGYRDVEGTAWAYRPCPPQGPYLVEGKDL